MAPDDIWNLSRNASHPPLTSPPPPSAPPPDDVLRYPGRVSGRHRLHPAGAAAEHGGTRGGRSVRADDSGEPQVLVHTGQLLPAQPGAAQVHRRS